MTLVFASFGYRAPHNPMVVTMLLVSASLFAGSVYLVLDMDIPFSGPIQISDDPCAGPWPRSRRSSSRPMGKAIGSRGGDRLQPRPPAANRWVWQVFV
ncbi:bestrophin-like domain [Pseudomonas sp. OTU5201]|uniref:bestrophin-like domain n=1 Tax=Pseudomonas sp. OTU5201 TaxID=3043850 RepID=UPI00406D2FC8